MRQKKGFSLEKICGEYVITANSMEHIDFNKLLTFNPTAVYLWQQVEGKEFTPESLAQLLIQKYQVTEDIALSDAQKLCKVWLEAGIIDL